MKLYNEDCLEGMKRLAAGTVDMILTDLPYNVTDCAWDKSAIDLDEMWQEFKRVLKPYCATVLFASGKFTHKLIASNFEQYKYKWIWVKNAPTFFVHAKNAPMRKFEEILVFSDGVINHASCTNRRMKYNPQGVVPTDIIRRNDDYTSAGVLKSQLRSPFVKSNDKKLTDSQWRQGKLRHNSHLTDETKSKVAVQGGAFKGKAVRSRFPSRKPGWHMGSDVQT